MPMPVSEKNHENKWHTLGPGECCQKLHTSPVFGLDDGEAARRRSVYGPNTLAEKPARGLFLLFLDQLKEVLVIVLIIAAAISAAL